MALHDEIAERLNDIWSDGYADEEYGSLDVEGFTAALILTDPDVDGLQGIIREDAQGYVEYEVFSGIGEAQDQWREATAEWDRIFHPEADS